VASKKEYQSAYGGGLITNAAYLVEYICERIARKDKKQLPMKFWNDPAWGKIFRTQIVHANRLLEECTCLQIMNALRSKELYKVYSLGMKKVILDKAKSFSVGENITVPEYELPHEVEDWTVTIDDVCAEELVVDQLAQSLWEKLS
jgi:hypothetical protein